MAVDMFIKVGDLKGESIDDSHKEWIDVISWSWGMSNSGTSHMGPGGGGGKVNIQDLTFNKYIDFSSTALQLACCSGKHFKEAMLTLRKAGGVTPLEYLKIKMETVLVSSVQSGGSSGGDDRFMEAVTLNFAKVLVEYQKQDAKGAKDGGPATLSWDIPANIKKG